MSEVQTISSRLIYENRWMRLREDQIIRENGCPGIYSVVEKPTFAMVVPWDGLRFTMVSVFRYPVGRRFWEFPQGTMEGLDEHPGEEVARNELREEAGLLAGRITRVGRLFIAYGLTNQAFDVFVAEDLTRTEHQPEPEEGTIGVGQFTEDEIGEMIDSGEIADSGTVAAFHLWSRYAR